MRLRRYFLALVASLVCCVALSAAAQTVPIITYTYDTLGRVTTATYAGGPNNGLVITYTYDAAGNRTQYTSNGVGNTHTPTVVVVPLLGFTLIVTGQ